MRHLSTAASVIPTGLPWDAEATVVGILIVVLLLVAFGWLVPRWYIKALERKYEFERELNTRNTEAIEEIAGWAKKQNDVGDNLAHTLSTLQQRGGDNE